MAPRFSNEKGKEDKERRLPGMKRIDQIQSEIPMGGRAIAGPEQSEVAFGLAHQFPALDISAVQRAFS